MAWRPSHQKIGPTTRQPPSASPRAATRRLGDAVPSGHSSGSVRQEKHAVDLITEGIQFSLQGVGTRGHGLEHAKELSDHHPVPALPGDATRPLLLPDPAALAAVTWGRIQRGWPS